MSDQTFLLAAAGVLVSSAGIIAFVRSLSARKSAKKTSFFDLSK